jgi:hypothetical protein
MSVSRTGSCLGLSLISFLLAPGCTFGPEALTVTQSRYNDAIQYTTNEQLLLNLVRLRYRDAPVFAQISSVST